MTTAVIILVVMALLGLVELAIPLHPRTRWNRFHLHPNLTLTLITFATNMIYGTLLVMALLELEQRGGGLLARMGLSSLAATLVGVVVLDLSFYVAHVAMHKLPSLWRVHQVHHSDPAVDVTTTIRQHPLEGVIRYGFMSVAALALGVSPATYVLYRGWAALHGLFEHANIRLPQRFEALLTLVMSSPSMHKVHHSRRVDQTDTNYSNLFVFDRLFGTFTPAEVGREVVCGLEGYDQESQQTTSALLTLPFERQSAEARPERGHKDAPNRRLPTAATWIAL